MTAPLMTTQHGTKGAANPLSKRDHGLNRAQFAGNCGLVVATMISVLMFGLAGFAFADPTGNQGQPSQSCESQPSAPGGGNSSQSSGSPFTGGSSGDVYANGPGSTPNGGVTNSTAVSQYDVACFQVSQPHP